MSNLDLGTLQAHIALDGAEDFDKGLDKAESKSKSFGE